MSKFKALIRFILVSIRANITGLESIYLDNYEVINMTLDLKKIKQPSKKNKAVGYLSRLYKK